MTRTKKPAKDRQIEDLTLEVERLKARLEESQELIGAIREGRVDALVAYQPEGEQIYTMKTADRGYRNLVENMGQGAVILFKEDIFYCNRCFADMIKRSRESITGSRFTQYVSAEDRVKTRDFIQSAGKNNLRLETFIVSDHDNLVPVYLSATPLTVGAFSGTCLVVTDLTEQKRTDRLLKEVTQRQHAEEALVKALKANEQHLAQLTGIVGQMTEGLVIFDPHGNLLEMNPAALKMHGFDDVESLQQNIDTLKDLWELYGIDGNVLPTELWPVGRVLSGETFADYEVYIRRRDTGAAWWGSYGGSPVYDRNGNMILAILTLRDITTQREAEEIVQKTYKELEKTVAERTTALRLLTEQLRQLTMQLTVAEKKERKRIARLLHDHMQQLLVGAKMQLEFLSQNVESDEQIRLNKSVEMIVESLKMSRSLTEELAPQALEHENVAKLLEWVCDFMNKTYSLEVDLKVGDEIQIRNPDVRFFIYQAVRELLFNVVKHAGTDTAQVRLYKDESGYTEITVSDRGKGFDADLIYEEESLGSHFGLFSLRERVSLLKGTMKLESTPEKGTECVLILPFDEIEASEQPEQEIFFETVSQTKQTNSTGKIRVLVVDDHDMVREAFVSLIEKEPDIEIVGQADNGVEAVNAALALIPDVILMDINMPEMDGIEATRAIVSRLPEVRIIGLSIDASKVTVADMLSAGASDFVGKESGSEVVLAAIRKQSGSSKSIHTMDETGTN